MFGVAGELGLPGGVAVSDRQLLWGAGAIGLVMAVLTIVFAPVLPPEQSKVPSTYSSAEGGARAAFLLLQELHYPVRRWEEPPSELPVDDPAIVLILAEPTQAASASDKKQLLRFVQAGGRVLFCGRQIPQFFPMAERKDKPSAELTMTANLPSQWTRGAGEIVMASSTEWGQLNTEQVSLYEYAGNPQVVSWQLGKGQVLWWAAATPLTNAGVARKNNLNLFLNAVSASGTDEGPKIYWDEYFHGERSSVWMYFERTVLKWVLVQLGVMAVFVLFTFSRRWGPVFRARPVSRLSPLEFVDTLGGLYSRAGATSVPVSVAYKQLKLSMARRLAVPVGSPDADLASVAASRLGWDEVDFAGVLRRAAAGQDADMRPREALKIVQGLEQYRARLLGMRSVEKTSAGTKPAGTKLIGLRPGARERD